MFLLVQVPISDWLHQMGSIDTERSILVKKLVSFFVVIVTLLSMACPAFAAENSNGYAVSQGECRMPRPSDDAGVMPMATLALSFSSLATNNCVKSSETYYISDGNSTLNVISATWNSQAEEVGIGWYRIDTGIVYYVRYSGGSVSNKKISSKTLPAGNYHVAIMNLGNNSITGALQYSVS